MALIKCKECGHEISDEALTCPNCGKPQRNKLLSVSLSKQMAVYSVSLFLPPFGFWYAWKYLKQPDNQSRKIGIVAAILTILSILASIWLTEGFIASIGRSFDSLNNLNF